MSEARIEASSSTLIYETVRLEWDDDRPRKATETGHGRTLREVIAEVSSATITYTFTGKPRRDEAMPDWAVSISAKGAHILKSGKPGEPRDLTSSFYMPRGELGEWLNELAAQHRPDWKPVIERRPS